MDVITHPVLLYLACAVGAIGIALALPRRGVSPQALGAIIAAIGGGLLLIAILPAAGAHVPNVFFYIFSAIALGACLRVITHPRPVYAALYFIMTILASCGLYLILAAEFMAFALVIVYAGAILITYLFVIMLATQAPRAGDVEAMAEYDRFSREPIAATVAGFILLAVLATVLGRGAGALQPASEASERNRIMQQFPRKVETALLDAGILEPGESVADIDADARTATIIYGEGAEKTVPWPDELVLTNTEGVGYELLVAKPGAIEIAGVILLMAMLGAVVLARKKVDLDEQAKLRAQQRHLELEGSAAA